MVVLAHNGYFGPRQIISDKAIVDPEAFNGVTIRTPPIVMWIKTLEAMGGRAINLAWPEVYSGLASGVVDAAEAPLGSLYGSKLHEVKKVISKTGHFKPFTGWIIGTNYFDKLPEEYQKILKEEAVKTGEYMTELTLDSQEEYEEMFKKEGVEFVEVDVQKFREATEIVYQQFPEWTPGLHEEIMKILED
jgi:TRAP-type transport system periplasmic protein